MNTRRGRPAVAVAVVVMLGGCGTSSRTPGAASGHYAGRSGSVGAVMDFRATDPTVERLRVLLAPRRVRVVSAYVVNRSDTPIVIPTFSAERFDGRIATMERADADPLVGRAGIVLPASIPGNGAATVYLLTRERPEAVTAVVMHPAKGVSIRLSPQDG